MATNSNIWGPAPVANQATPAADVWGRVPPPSPQITVSPPSSAPVAPSQELTPDEKKIFEGVHYDVNKLQDAWELADGSLAIAKMREMALRKVLFKVRFPSPTVGTNNITLANGDILKAVVKYNYSFDSDTDKVEAALNLMEKIGGPEGKFISERITKWTPSLVKKEYDILIEDAKKDKTKEQMLLAINQVITKTPATPSLEITTPKGKQ